MQVFNVNECEIVVWFQAIKPRGGPSFFELHRIYQAVPDDVAPSLHIYSRLQPDAHYRQYIKLACPLSTAALLYDRAANTLLHLPKSLGILNV